MQKRVRRPRRAPSDLRLPRTARDLLGALFPVGECVEVLLLAAEHETASPLLPAREERLSLLLAAGEENGSALLPACE